MNCLGIDHGSKRVGLAIGSTEGGVAAPLKVSTNSGDTKLIEDLKAVIVSEDIGQLVIGLPLSKDGGHSDQERVVRRFAEKLEDAFEIPIVLQDERLSSMEIERQMNMMGGRKAWKAAGFDRDTAAATLILQTYLDRTRTE